MIYTISGVKYATTPTRETKREPPSYAVSLHFAHYNFARVHRSLRVTTAMEAGLGDRLWSLERISRT
jgi:hypothetical protein